MLLGDLGRREEALAAIEEAVAIRRALAEARPDAFLPSLAGALNNQSNRLSGLGRREEALAAIEEAVTIRRQLAQARPDAFLPDLATALNNRSRSGIPVGAGAAGGCAGRDRGGRRHLPGAGRCPAGRVPARPRHVAEQPVESAVGAGAAGGCAGRDRGGRHDPTVELAAGIRPDAFLSPTWPCR